MNGEVVREEGLVTAHHSVIRRSPLLLRAGGQNGEALGN